VWRTNPTNGFPELLVQRTVHVQEGTLIQGFWMDWPALRARLRTTTSDLLPAAGLIPLTGAAAELAPGALRLASLPVLLSPGPAPSTATPWLSTTHGTLALTWLAVAGAIIAIGVVLRASMDLSDRRGRFVSAVTHELRTPLTTFCMYTEMLAGGMVPDQSKREYLATLRTESARLAGIVENVLDYARLGGAARVNGQPRTSASDLLDRSLPTLRRRAEAAGMELDSRIEGVNRQMLAADPATFERILLNLVDNSCKYAAAGRDRRIHLLMAPAGSGVQITVRDHGPGVPRAEFGRIFRPFHRAKRDADGPQSGLGLGLALARGLARSLGGDLRLARDSREGAEFTLTLPAHETDEPT
jgi:signal transduction histidine kinase